MDLNDVPNQFFATANGPNDTMPLPVGSKKEKADMLSQYFSTKKAMKAQKTAKN